MSKRFCINSCSELSIADADSCPLGHLLECHARALQTGLLRSLPLASWLGVVGRRAI